MKDTIFIPKKCKVGFNPRSDTYTGMLGYVIYNDGKVWRKEKSWIDWIYQYTDDLEFERQKNIEYEKTVQNILDRCANAAPHRLKDGKVEVYFGYNTGISGSKEIDKNITKEELMTMMPYSKFIFHPYKSSNDPKIKPVEFDNVPLEGFVLNKKAGGTKYGWNARQTYCRVYDPRGFEFEITIPNLLYVLDNANSMKGKGLEGKFVYGWDGKDLVLVPESAPEYQQMVSFTELLDASVKKSELILGGMYIDSQKNILTYMGDAYEIDWNHKISANKKLWFSWDKTRIGTKDIKTIKRYTGEINPDYANLVDLLEKKDSYTKDKAQYEKFPITYNPMFGNSTSNLDDILAKKYEWRGFVKINDVEKNKTSLKEIRIEKSRWRNDRQLDVYVSRKLEHFDSVKQILNKYELWQQKTTK